MPSAEVKMPSGKTDKPVIEDNRDGTVSLKYEPREEGLHELLVKYNGEHVQGEWKSHWCHFIKTFLLSKLYFLSMTISHMGFNYYLRL